MSKNKKSTEHHCVPTSRGGSNEDVNKTHLSQKEHEAYHIIGANMEPHEVAMHILMINRKSFDNEWFTRALAVLSEGREAIYKPEAYIEAMRWETRDDIASVFNTPPTTDER